LRHLLIYLFIIFFYFLIPIYLFNNVLEKADSSALASPAHLFIIIFTSFFLIIWEKARH